MSKSNRGGDENYLFKVDEVRKDEECFNAQGYPKDYILPNISNGRLYKAAGNSVVVSVIERIANQINKVL